MPSADEILTRTADALVSVDGGGTIESRNPAAERLLGFAARDAVGQTLAILVPPAVRLLHIAGFHRAMETGRLASGGAPVLVTATRADGSSVELEMTLGLRHDTTGRPVGAVAALRPTGPRRPLADLADLATDGRG